MYTEEDAHRAHRVALLVARASTAKTLHPTFGLLASEHTRAAWNRSESCFTLFAPLQHCDEMEWWCDSVCVCVCFGVYTLQRRTACSNYILFVNGTHHKTHFVSNDNDQKCVCNHI